MSTTLKFNEKAHRYWLDGRPIPGVTTLIKGGLPAPALTYWAARTVAEWVADHDAEVEQLRGMGRASMVAALKETPWTARDQAGARGTEVHAIGERLIHGGEVEDVPEHLVGHVDAYVRWLDAWQPTAVLVEHIVAHRAHWWAGRFDLIVDMAGDRWLLDLKTAKGVYGDNALQTDAYRNAEFYVDSDNNEQPMPEGITRLGVVHIRADGADLVPLESNGDPYKDFRHAAWISNAAKRIKGYVGEPIPAPELSQTGDAA